MTQESELTQSGIDIIAVKPEATILDATASNRSMWRIKDSEYVLFIDIELELEIKPDLIIDCTQTKFPSHSIGTIFFDPPHWWGDELGDNYYSCRNALEERKFVEKYNYSKIRRPPYYGTDKYKTKSELLSFIHKAQKEFYRILRKDGILWLIWSEVKIPLRKILPFFKNWNEMIRLEIGSSHQTISDFQNYWIMFMKKPEPIFHLDLATITTKHEGESNGK